MDLQSTTRARSVTAVGGMTQIPEIAANLSGGGFSDVVRFAPTCSGFVTLTFQ
jgi:hypothetical protein